MAYVENVQGTFSPTLDGSVSSPTVSYTTQVGTYQKIGQLIIATVHMVINTTSGGSGNVRIATMPFTSRNVTNEVWMAPVLIDGVDADTGVLYYVVNMGANSATCSIQGIRDNTTVLQLPLANVANGDTFKFTISYLAAT
jgi:hypothetical protein